MYVFETITIEEIESKWDPEVAWIFFISWFVYSMTVEGTFVGEFYF